MDRRHGWRVAIRAWCGCMMVGLVGGLMGVHHGWLRSDGDECNHLSHLSLEGSLWSL